MLYLRGSTATAVLVGPFLDSTDGITPETSLTVTSMDVDLYKHSNTHPLTVTTFTASAATISHVANGYYSFSLSSTDTNTVGRLNLSVNITGAMPVFQEFMVLHSTTYDCFYAQSASIRSNVIQWNGTNVGTPDTAGYPVVTVKNGTGAGEIATTGGAINNVTRTASANIVERTLLVDYATLTASATILDRASLVDVVTVTSSANVAVSIADKVDYYLTAAATASLIDGIWDELQSGHTTANTFGKYLDIEVSTRQVTGSVTTLTSSQVATAVWSELQAGYVTAGTFGYYLDGEVSSASAPSSAQVAAAVLGATIDAATSAPSAPYNIENILSWLLAITKFKRTQTSSTETVYGDDGTTSISTSSKSDDGTTFSRNEYS